VGIRKGNAYAYVDYAYEREAQYLMNQIEYVCVLSNTAV
jgi:hypothetical protein